MEDLVEITKAARMKFKPPKFRILVLRRGRVRDRFHFKIGEDVVPTVWAGGVDLKGRGSGSRALVCAKPHCYTRLVDETGGTWGENPVKPQGLKHMAPPPVAGSDLYANNPHDAQEATPVKGGGLLCRDIPLHLPALNYQTSVRQNSGRTLISRNRSVFISSVVSVG